MLNGRDHGAQMNFIGLQHRSRPITGLRVSKLYYVLLWSPVLNPGITLLCIIGPHCIGLSFGFGAVGTLCTG